MRARYLLWDAREYRAWLNQQIELRKTRYPGPLEPGLLSMLTPVWDGTPLSYFRLLAQSIIQQNAGGEVEWVVLDNGCRHREILNDLAALQKHSWIKITRSEQNVGIIGGLRLCLEAAACRYILPVDSDDLLYPDCLQVVTSWLRSNGYPPILYTDEDKIIGESAVQPYLKPDFDPVLLLNSAYIAHLGVIERKLALEHGAYADKSTEGSPDWDLFTRFFVAGRPAVHIPEVVYSWRMHPESTADDAGSKPYIHSSQKAVLQRYLDSTGFADKFHTEYSPLLPGTCDWWLHRRPVNPVPAMLISVATGKPPGSQLLDYPDVQRFSLSLNATARTLAELVSANVGSGSDLVCLLSDDLVFDRGDWLWEALGLFERFPDTVMIGGRIRNSAGQIISAAYVLGFGAGCDCPDRGRPALDPGYFTQMMKQHSASSVSSQFTVFQAGALSALTKDLPAETSLAMLGPWIGAWALRNKKRVIYSPFLSGVSEIDWDALPAAEERTAFLNANRTLMPDHRFYPKALGMLSNNSYRLVRQ